MHGGPIFKQWAEASFTLRKMHNSRAHADLQALHSYGGQAESHQCSVARRQLLQFSECFAGVLKHDWRAELKVCETTILPFDGHCHVEDLHFNCLSMDRLQVLQGCFGIVEPWKGSKEKFPPLSHCCQGLCSVFEPHIK